MAESASFDELLQRIRAGDGSAAADLVRQYEPVIRLEVKMRMTDPRLRRVLDSMDICQSVLASFFVRAAAGQYELNEPKDLVRLLVGIARNKVAFQARKQHAQRRDQRREQAVDPDLFDPADPAPSPSEVVCGEELLREFRQRLSGEEREVAERRARGDGWDEIAAALGGTGQGRRKQLERAIARVSQELGLEEADEAAEA
jgi:DNA-directed RNA polymerase specialized sigma24 family protein